MSEDELKGILNAKVTNSLGYYGGKLSKARVQALQYYNGEPFGNELDGRSQVISRDVAEAIDSMMPPLMKIFSSGESVVRFDPTRPQDEEIAKQVTDYINWIWNQQNEGFRNTFNWFKDALLNRVAAVKIWWDEQEDITKEQYEGLTDQEFALLLSDTQSDALEVLEHNSYPDPLAAAASSPSAPGAGAVAAVSPQPPSPPQMPSAAVPTSAMGMLGHNGGPPLPPPMLHDVTIRRTNKTGRCRILPIPGEEFLMDRRAVSLDETPFVCHRVKKTISDLVEMGYPWDLVKSLGEGDSSDFNLERLERFRQEDELPYRQGNNYDPSMKEVWVNECYLKVDYDGDGIAELRKITFAGEAGNFAPGATVILDNEETDDHPFAALTPIPMPHKFYGMSMADQTQDLQLIKSTILRASLDHTYNAIMPQLGVVDGQVNLDDLLTRKPSGVVRMRNPDAIVPIPTGQMGVDPLEMIGYLDQVREQRTGVRRFVAGPDADALANPYTRTATGANIVENSSQERIELVARCYAEIGVKPAFRKILKLVSKHQNKPKIIRLRGKWVPMDPREWDTEFDLTITVGLGSGNRAQQIQTMAAMLNLDDKIIMLQQGLNGPILTGENFYKHLDKMCEYGGLHSAESYYTDPGANPQAQQPPKPDPKMVEAQGKLQIQQAQTQAEMVSQQARLRADVALSNVKAQHDMELEKQRAVLDAQLEQQKAQHQMDLERMKLAHQMEMDRTKLAHDTSVKNAELQQKQTENKTPKVSKVSLMRDAGGKVSSVRRHYDDGSHDVVPIERVEVPAA